MALAIGVKRARDEASPGCEDNGAAALESKYDVGDVLGEGAFATVKLATRKADGQKFAMKLIRQGGMTAAQVEHERDILVLLGLHRHIVSLVDNFVLPDETAFVMELADGGVEVVAQLDVVVREGLGDAIGQVAAGEMVDVSSTESRHVKTEKAAQMK